REPVLPCRGSGLEGARGLEARGLDGAAHPRVVLAVGIGEERTPRVELVLDPLPRVSDLAGELVVRKPGQVSVRDGVSTDLDAGPAGELAQLGPAHRRKLVQMRFDVGGELGDVERPTTIGRETGA